MIKEPIITREVRIRDLKDGARFKLKKSSRVIYVLQTKERTKAYFTSENSNKTFTCKLSEIVYPK